MVSYLTENQRDMIERNKSIKEMTRQRKELKQAERDYAERKSPTAQIIKYAESRPKPNFKGKTGRFSKNISSGIVRMIGYKSGNVQQGKRSVGRPRQVYIHRSPFNGRPIPAPLYYKEMRLFKRQQNIIAEKRMQDYRQYLAQKGINPQQQQVNPQIQQPNPQIVQRVSVPMAQQQIQPAPQVQRPIWRQNGYQDTDWGLFGTKQVIRGTEKSFWN